MEPNTLQAAVLYFADPENCRKYLVAHRWPNGVTCPRCGSKNVLFQPKYNRWQCGGKHDRRQFTSKTGTIFEDSPLGLDKWLLAMWLVVNCKNGVSSYEIHRAVGVTQKTAWFMDHRIRLALGMVPGEKLSGEVEADETYVGGKQRNMHFEKKMRKYISGEMNKAGSSGKAIVMGILERNTKQVRATVIPEAKKAITDAQLQQHVEPGSTLYTDEAPIYESLPEYAREFINHTESYVRGAVHTNTLENFWSLLKRSLAGTYISVEPYHLQAYVDEQAYRFNNRKLTDGERFSLAVSGIVGKRITFQELTGKTADQAA